MADTLTLDDVDHVAALAHLELTDDERRTFLAQLNDVLEYARQIQSIDTADIPPTSHAAHRYAPDRPDEPGASLPIDAALAGAPDASASLRLFRVPRVID